MITSSQGMIKLNGNAVSLYSTLSPIDPENLGSQYYYMGMAHAFGLMVSEFETMIADFLLSN